MDHPRFYMSAYGIARKNGFTGTEAEWLASLKGTKGDALTYADLTAEQKAALTAGIQSALEEIITQKVAEALAALEAAAEAKADQIYTDCAAKATAAGNSATAAEGYKDTAQAAAQTATQKTNGLDDTLQAVTNQAKKAESYAQGGTDTRTGEDTDNAKYYAEQCAAIYQQQRAFMDIMDTLSSTVTAMGVTLASLSDQLTAVQAQADAAGAAVEDVEDLKEQLGDVATAIGLIDETLDAVNEGESGT